MRWSAMASRMSSCFALTIAAALAGLAIVPSAHARRAPACFGAAARDRLRPCRNPRLRLSVTPTPDDAPLVPNVPCGPVGPDRVDAFQCVYGAPADQAVETVAIIGDSHAWHWRPALALVAATKRWRVVELSMAHCPLTTATPRIGNRQDVACPNHGRLVLAWLQAHPEVRTVFVSSFSRLHVVARRGRSEFQTRIDGFLGAWSRLPPSAQRIIVLRDPPRERFGTHDCVRRAIARRLPPGSACALPRSALAPDAGVSTAKLLASRGARVIDLSRFFCSRTRCFPVIGGVLVHKDDDHLTTAFAETLAPYLLRSIDAVLDGGA